MKEELIKISRRRAKLMREAATRAINTNKQLTLNTLVDIEEQLLKELEKEEKEMADIIKKAGL